MQTILVVALAGAVGTICRYGLNRAFPVPLGAFPWSTFLANCIGSLLFGLIFVAAERGVVMSATTRVALLVGFFGAFTTFSTFAFEVSHLIESGRIARAGLHLLAHNLCGVACLLAGLWAGRALTAG